MLPARGGGTVSQQVTRWLRTVPQCRMSRASILGVLLGVLLLSWSVSVWRGGAELGTRRTRMDSCAPVASADCVCPTQVLQAIEQLERLKTEVHSGNAVALAAAAVATSAPLPAAAAPVLATPVSAGSAKPFLLIAIPSMPRAADYLSAALDALDAQLVHDAEDPLFGSIVVWVMNNAPAGTSHPVFDSNRARFSGRREFHFLVNEHTLQELPGASRHDQNGAADKPGVRVRKQTRDIARLMQLAAGQSRYYMAMEDDFLACPHALRMVEHALRKATATASSPNAPPPLHQAWITVKFSYGFNGLVLHNNEDLAHFAEYLLEHQGRRPPDHLNTEWSCSEKPASLAYVQNRPHITYRYNLFDHMGKVSSLRPHQNDAYPGCFHKMDTGVVFEVDAFNFATCAHDDVSPCLPKDDKQWIPLYGIDQAVVDRENAPKQQ